MPRAEKSGMGQILFHSTVDKHVQGKGYMTISKQLDVPVTAVAHICKKFKIYWTVTNLPGHGHGNLITKEMDNIHGKSKQTRTASKETKGGLKSKAF